MRCISQQPHGWLSSARKCSHDVPRRDSQRHLITRLFTVLPPFHSNTGIYTCARERTFRTKMSGQFTVKAIKKSRDVGIFIAAIPHAAGYTLSPLFQETIAAVARFTQNSFLHKTKISFSKNIVGCASLGDERV